MSKSHNPFGMFGSYVGAFIGFFIIPAYYEVTNKVCTLPCTSFFSDLQFVSLWGVGIFLGFLLGYGIHSLVRALR